MKKVLIPTKLDSIASEMLSSHGGYEALQLEGKDLSDLAADHADAYAFIVRSEPVTDEIMALFPSLKVIIRAGAGYNTIDTKAARKRGIDVMNTPGANANAVAEEVVALMLSDARHVVPGDISCRSGLWEKKKFMGREITGKTLGIVGLGHIGRLLAQRVSGFGMEVLAFDPVVNQDRASELGVTMVTLEQLFERSDYVSLHLPENDHTRGLIAEPLLSLMKEGASLINCARDGVVNHADIAAAKEAKGIHYLNDVYPKDEAGEKPVAAIADIMLPHLGASTREANENAARMAAQQLIDLDEKGITSAIVNRDIPAGLDESFGHLAFALTVLARRMLAGAPLKVVETSSYGSLKPYAEWLVVPVVCALDADFDRSVDHRGAERYLNQAGIDYQCRQVDDLKGYENSVTIDLVGGIDSDHLRRVSVRGTVAEGRLIVSRIGDFDGLYFEPRGHLLVVTYKDRPGVLAQIAGALGKAGINIDDVRNPHDKSGARSIAVVHVNQPIPATVLDALRKDVEADAAFYHDFGH